LDSISKLQTYITKVDSLCQLIYDDNINIDQALIIYRQKIEHDNDTIEKSNDKRIKSLSYSIKMAKKCLFFLSLGRYQSERYCETESHH